MLLNAHFCEDGIGEREIDWYDLSKIEWSH